MNPPITKNVQLHLLDKNQSHELIYNSATDKDVQISIAKNISLKNIKDNIPEFLCKEAREIINNRINEFELVKKGETGIFRRIFNFFRFLTI